MVVSSGGQYTECQLGSRVLFMNGYLCTHPIYIMKDACAYIYIFIIIITQKNIVDSGPVNEPGDKCTNYKLKHLEN